MIQHRKRTNITYEEIKIPVYNAVLIICSTPDIENSKQYFKYNLAPEFKYTKNEAVVARLNTGYYILNFHKTLQPKDITHESCHLTNYLFSDFGIKLDLSNDENFAYQCSWFYERIESFIKRIK